MTNEPKKPSKKVAEILVVEDNPQDVLLTRSALKELEVPYSITIAQDAEQALAILNQEGEHSSSELPNIILLDLGLPKMAGIDLLKAIKNNTALKHIPVIVLTGSLQEKDIIESYDLKAHSYIVKPVDVDKQRIIGQLLKIQGF